MRDRLRGPSDMAKIEVDEVEWNNSKVLRETISKLMSDPKRAAKIEELRKEIEPNAPTPHLDQIRLTSEPVEAVNKKIAELEKRLAEEKAENEKNSKLAALQTKVDAGNAQLLKEGWTQDGITKLTEFREKEGILDPIHAAAVYEKINGAQTAPMQPSSGFGSWNFTELPKDEEGFVKKLLESKGQNDRIVENEAMKVLNEFRGPSRR